MWIISFIYYFYLFRCFTVSFERKEGRHLVKLANIQKTALFILCCTHLGYFSHSHILFGWLLLRRYWIFVFVRFTIKPNLRNRTKREHNDLCETILLHIACDFSRQNSMQWRKCGGYCCCCCWKANNFPFFLVEKLHGQTFFPTSSVYLVHCSVKFCISIEIPDQICFTIGITSCPIVCCCFFDNTFQPK